LFAFCPIFPSRHRRHKKRKAEFEQFWKENTDTIIGNQEAFLKKWQKELGITAKKAVDKKKKRRRNGKGEEYEEEIETQEDVDFGGLVDLFDDDATTLSVEEEGSSESEEEE
jgi:uncharacterized protein with von Willebrand factor type A (vWA) domain